MPIYNKLSYLRRSIDSVQSQIYPYFELVCIDDCSSDNSTGYIIERMKKDSRIKLVQHIYNQGTNFARINGLYHCTGLYIMSLDPDDIFYFDAIYKNYFSATELDADVLEYRIKVKLKKGYINNWYGCSGSYSNNSVILNKLAHFNINWNLCKKLIKRELYLRAVNFVLPYVKGKRIVYAEDLLQCGTVFLFMKSFVCGTHQAYLYFFFNSDNSESGKFQPICQNKIQFSYIKAVLTYFLSHINNLHECNLQQFYRNATVRSLFNSVYNISRIPIKKCRINIKGFRTNKFYDKGYCLITRSHRNRRILY